MTQFLDFDLPIPYLSCNIKIDSRSFSARFEVPPWIFFFSAVAPPWSHCITVSTYEPDVRRELRIGTLKTLSSFQNIAVLISSNQVFCVAYLHTVLSSRSTRMVDAMIYRLTTGETNFKFPFLDS